YHAGRCGTDCNQAPHLDRVGGRSLNRGIFRSAFDSLELGEPSWRRGTYSSGLVLPLLPLSRLECAGNYRRYSVESRGLDGRGELHWRPSGDSHSDSFAVGCRSASSAEPMTVHLAVFETFPATVQTT